MPGKAGVSVVRFIALVACAFAAGAAPAWAEQRCTSFAGYAEHTPFPQHYRQGGFKFDFGNETNVIFDHAIIFDGQGATIKTPFAGRKVRLELKAHTGQGILVNAINSAGDIVQTFDQGGPYPSPLVINFKSDAGDIVKLALEGGGNESGISRVCVTRD